MHAVELCIDVVEPRPVAAFWTSFLGYSTADSLDSRWVHLEPPSGLPVINLQRVPEAKSIKNRLHLDVFVDDPPEWIAHATALGATLTNLHDDEADWFCVMADPAGNEFCICLERAPSG
ncbi:MAG: glyoxalase [Acidimicrobiales bacterium]|nr:glyoxalase [Acidimicrobiales bacterium]